MIVYGRGAKTPDGDDDDLLRDLPTYVMSECIGCIIKYREGIREPSP